MDIQAHVETILPVAVEQVFDAIINPRKMAHYFVSSATKPMIEGETVTWAFDDVGGKLDVVVNKVKPNEMIAFEWQASGVNTQVDMLLQPQAANQTRLSITETGWDMDKAGVDRALEQTQGWTDFVSSMKAYLLFGVNLRRGVMIEAENPTLQSQRNKDIALDFLKVALVNGKPDEASRMYLAPVLKQHNPNVADGAQALVESITSVVSNNPEATWEPKRAIAEGDLVVVHGHRRFNRQDLGAAVVNIFRFANGKIVEQWNVGQPVPETAANPNTMF